eukprot:EG_transcript_7866
MSVFTEAISKMDGSVGWDAVIVCTSNQGQEDFWQTRLEATQGHAARAGALILAVHEDWAPGGAGNGLGTLYAYVKARAKAQVRGVDLDAQLQAGWAVALFHTAGKGTRLAPLPGSENNNKPGVKLPARLEVAGQPAELTILEAVVRQTNSYAPGRPRRLSVFWGDQIFIPSAGTPPSGAHHADILACLGSMPTEAEWAERGLEKYGLIAVGESGEATQVEKVTHATALALLKSFGEVKAVGPSLGSFSVSDALLLALLREFAAEVEGKEAKFDSDPHFWMPLTLSGDSYRSIMSSKGVPEAESTAHFNRMTEFKQRFLASHPEAGLFGCIDAGTQSYWWDYGQLPLYHRNSLLVRATGPEADALRAFLRIDDRRAGSVIRAEVDEESVVLSSVLPKGTVRNSVCSSVRVGEAALENCLLVNVTARRVVARNCVLYNVTDASEEGVVLPDGAVRADVVPADGQQIVLRSTLETDGGKVWKERVHGNGHSFEEVYTLNNLVDVSAAQRCARSEWISVFPPVVWFSDRKIFWKVKIKKVFFPFLKFVSEGR